MREPHFIIGIFQLWQILQHTFPLTCSRLTCVDPFSGLSVSGWLPRLRGGAFTLIWHNHFNTWCNRINAGLLVAGWLPTNETLTTWDHTLWVNFLVQNILPKRLFLQTGHFPEGWLPILFRWYNSRAPFSFGHTYSFWHLQSLTPGLFTAGWLPIQRGLRTGDSLLACIYWIHCTLLWYLCDLLPGLFTAGWLPNLGGSYNFIQTFDKNLIPGLFTVGWLPPFGIDIFTVQQFCNRLILFHPWRTISGPHTEGWLPFLIYSLGDLVQRITILWQPHTLSGLFTAGWLPIFIACGGFAALWFSGLFTEGWLPSCPGGAGDSNDFARCYNVFTAACSSSCTLATLPFLQPLRQAEFDTIYCTATIVTTPSSLPPFLYFNINIFLIILSGLFHVYNWPLQYQDTAHLLAALALVFVGVWRHIFDSTPGVFGTTSDHIPGPKSRHHRKISRLALLCTGLLLLNMHNSACDGGEGCDRQPWAIAEADQQWLQQLTTPAAKPHGTRPSMCFGTSERPNAHPKVVKRSLLRATRRAQATGGAWYHGQYLRTHDFPPALQQKALTMSSPQIQRLRQAAPTSQVHSPRRRLRILTWNPGGLAAARLDELRHWALQQQADVVLLPETRWAFTNEWQDDHWCYVHTGVSDSRGAGVLCMISRRLSRLQSIKWTAIMDGRLLHVRLIFASRSVDVIGCYQYTNAHSKQRQLERKHWWTCLDEYLQHLPHRNMLVLAGDFNCSIGQLGTQVGSSTFRWKGKQHAGTTHPDQGSFASVIRGHGLVALNSWDAGPGPTYVKGTTASRLDYILVRRQTADGGARGAQHLWEAPILPVVQDGHAPVYAHVPFNWHHAPDSVLGSGITAHQRRRGCQSWQQTDESWMHFLELSRPALQHGLLETQHSAGDILDCVHNTLISTFKQCFPSNAQRTTEPAWSTTQQPCLNKWKHRAALKRFAIPVFRNCFRAWFHASQYWKLHRSQQKYAHLVRKAKFQALLQEAAQAAARHDSYQLFQLIHKHAPKAARRRMQLRNSTGALATPAEELAILKNYVATKWAGPSQLTQPMQTPPGVPFSEEELARAINVIPCHKAVAFPFAPGVAFKDNATIIAHHLYIFLESLWNQSPPSVPQSWRDGWLILIPKPHKSPSSPNQLRPLAMQDPIGKSVIGLLTSIARDQTQVLFNQWPLWAYQKERSTLDALAHVAEHCRRVCSLVQSQRPTAFVLQQKTVRYKTCGGMQLFLDIDHAFDGVNRSRLFQSLVEVGVDPRITSILTAWHCNTAYHLVHQGEDHRIDVGRGLRQGCKAAPYLWNSYLALCLNRLLQRLDIQFIRNNITIYADDVHMGGIFHNEHELEQLNLAMGIFLDTLREFELAVNPNKSAIIIAMSGTSFRCAWTDLTTRDSKGLWVKIKLPHDEHMYFPVVKSTKYLGVVVSYGHMEDQTLKHRLQMGRISFHRLHKWLCTKHGLPAQERFKLWQTCVFSVMQYGLLAIGITDSGLKHFQTTVFTMLRTVLRDHSFLTRRTHQQTLQHFHIDSPLALLHRAAVTLSRTVQERLARSAADDIIHVLNWQPLQALVQRLELMLMPGPLTSGAVQIAQVRDPDTHCCTLCGFTTTDVAEFRRHCTNIHGIPMMRTQTLNISDMALHGLPQCKYCLQTFTSWRTFVTHIQRGCQALHPGPSQCTLTTRATLDFRPRPSVPSSSMTSLHDRAIRGDSLLSDEDLQVLRTKPWGHTLLSIVTDRRFHQVRQEREACEYLTSYCGICGLFVGRLQSMQLHMRTHHSAFWQHVPTKSVQLCNQYAQESPCDFCGAIFKSQHMCPVWCQIALLLLHGGGTAGGDPLDFTPSYLRCDLCHELYEDAESLTAHLKTMHGLVSTSWNQSRDSLGGGPACSHCGTTYTSMASLRSHISQGRCPLFNPEAATETLPISPEWMRFCLRGQFLDLFNEPMTKLRLTLTCQCCDRRFRRSMDLAPTSSICPCSTVALGSGHHWDVG